MFRAESAQSPVFPMFWLLLSGALGFPVVIQYRVCVGDAARYFTAVKTLSVRDAQYQLSELLVEAARGDEIVLTDGDIQVTLTPRGTDGGFEPEEDSPELEAELLKAVRGPHAACAESELHEIADHAVQEQRARCRK